MGSLFDILLLVLSVTPVSASPVRRWLNTTSNETLTLPTRSVSLPLIATGTVEQAAANEGYTSSSDDCDDMSTAAYSSPTWPAALSTISTSWSVADDAYRVTQTAPAPTQQYQKASTAAAYTSLTSQPVSQGEAHPPYAVTDHGKHANTTAPAPSDHGAAKPYTNPALSGTTTLTLYTTIAPGGDSMPSAYDGASSNIQSVSSGINPYGGQTTSMAAYTNQQSSFASLTRTRGRPGPGSSAIAYGNESQSAIPSSEAASSYPERPTPTTHRPDRPTDEASSDLTTTIAAYSSSAEQATSSLPPAYPTPETSSEASSVEVDPVPTSYTPPSQAYSYSPSPSRSSSPSPAEPPILPTSHADSGPPQPYETDIPWLPSVVTTPPQSTTETISSTRTSDSSTSSSTSSSPMGGITIVPMDPDGAYASSGETVYATVTVTTTEAGMTTTVAEATVTAYA